MKRIFMIGIILICTIAFVMPAIAGDVQVKDGKLYVSAKIEKFVASTNGDAYLACGEDLRKTRGPEGNAWLQDKALKYKWPQYKFTKDGDSYVLPIPKELKRFNSIEGNIIFVDAQGKQSWVQLHEARKVMDFDFVTYKQSEDKWRSAFAFDPGK